MGKAKTALRWPADIPSDFGFYARLSVLLLTMLAVFSTRRPTSAQASELGVAGLAQAEINERMSAFLRAVERGDVDSIASFFPQNGDWLYERTTHTDESRRVGRWRLRPGDTRAAISSGPLSGTFLLDYEGQAIGALVHQIRHHPGTWRLYHDSRFVPPGGASDSPTYVTWRLEDGRWVVSSLADERFSGARRPPGRD